MKPWREPLEPTREDYWYSVSVLIAFLVVVGAFAMWLG